MQYVHPETGGVPAKMWIDHQEFFESESLIKQTLDISNLPMAFHHTALMPDAHSGFGMPIGGVLALDGAVCPSAVGYDIGCGMVAYKTNLPASELFEHRVAVNRLVKKAVPVGQGGDRNEPSRFHQLPVYEYLDRDNIPNSKVEEKIVPQMGTLGGGNHFIEFDYEAAYDEDGSLLPQQDGNVWIVIHSGSRGVGHGIADHYIKVAQNLNAKYWAPIPKDLACLPVDSPEGQQYIRALKYGLDWAFLNREIMMIDTLDALMSVVGQVKVLEEINVHHNDANLEHHFNRDVWVHRKGATRAREGERLVIPGNMGQGTAIGTGKGSVDSFHSTSHGAGRRMGRKEAQRTLDAEACKKRLDDLDVVLSCGRDGALDEMPEAYKDLNDVLASQIDLLDLEVVLRPMSCIKG